MERREVSHGLGSSLTSRVGAKLYQWTRKEAQQYSKLSSHTKLTTGVEARNSHRITKLTAGLGAKPP